MNKTKTKEVLMAELYDKLSSEFYDYHAKRGDIKFFTEYALESGGPVLELGCGTGRVLIPVARAGVQITGLDLSPEMLALARTKLAKEPASVRTRAALVQGDMRDFHLEGIFPLVTITWGPFNNLLTVADQLSCLASIKRHLKKGGRLIFDVFPANPDLLAIRTATVVVKDRPPFLMPDGRRVTWGLRFDRVDDLDQIIHEVLTYDIVYPDGRRERLLYPGPLRCYNRFEVEHLLARAGFAVEAVYTDYDKAPLGTTPPEDMIFVAENL